MRHALLKEHLGSLPKCLGNLPKCLGSLPKCLGSLPNRFFWLALRLEDEQGVFGSVGIHG